MTVNDAQINVSLTWSYDEDSEAPVQVFTVDYCVYDESGCYQLNPLYGDPVYPSLPYLLSTYGPPTQAYIGYDVGIREMGLGSDLYFLFLDYSKNGWIAAYQMELDSTKPVYTGCLERAQVTLTLWSPEDAEIANDVGFLDPAILKTVEQATGMMLQEFYEYFKDPTNRPCLESPANLYGP